MAQRLQVTFDCAHPQHLAEFWAQALGYQLQPPPEGFATWAEWAEKHDVPAEEADSLASVIDPTGEGPRILFQRVPEPKAVKNRVHLDVSVKRDETKVRDRNEDHKLVIAESERLKALGARELYRYDQYDEYWITMADPEGNEFCIQ